jgi:NifU-like protein involved in Fe-S cluster formation
MEDFTVSEKQSNSICGDDVTVYLKISERWVIEAFSYVGKPQIFTLAAASMLAEVIEWKSTEMVMSRGVEYMKNELWLDVSTRRQRSTVTALLAVHNAINIWKGIEKIESYEEIMEY